MSNDTLPGFTAETTRVCHVCGVRSGMAMFYLETEKRKRRGRIQCRLCTRTKNAARRKPRADYTDALKIAAGCADCGIRSPHPEIYDFDHRPDEVKVLPVAAYRTKGTMEEMLAEIAKCDIVCANCHRIRTHSLREYPAFGRKG